MRTFPVNKAGVSLTGVVWERGAPVNAIGRWTAVDTETTLIDDRNPRHIPDVVVLTAYSGGNVVDLVTWDLIPEYLDILTRKCDVFVYHNAPFDLNVLGMDRWIPIIDQDRILDTGLQWVLYKMGTIGLSDEAEEYPKLSRVVKDVLGVPLDKDSSVRCTFTRDMVLDETHMEYACGDAVATLLSAVAMSPDYVMPPTMGIQVKGHICLNAISRNGVLVDPKWMSDLQQEYLREKDGLKMTLKDLGLNVEKDLETKDIYPYLKGSFIKGLPEKCLLDDLKAAVILASSVPDGGVVEGWPSEQEVKALAKSWPERRPFGLPQKVTAKQLVNVLWKAAMNSADGKPIGDSMQEWWDEHDGWPPGYKQEGLSTQLQRLMAEAEQFASVPFARTEKGFYATNDEALELIPKVDLERIKFLGGLKKYRHAEKMASTYLDRKIIKSDGRVHSRFIPLKATGRTSSKEPNLQNLPRDDRIRSCYLADPGYVLCSCDYNQQELIALAQVTYSRFGHSLMRDLINNDIDIHAFMGSTIKGLFQGLPMFDVTDADIVAAYRKRISWFKETSPDEFKKLRQLAKALDDYDRCRFGEQSPSKKKVNCRDGIVCLSATKPSTGQTALRRKAHRLSREGVSGVMPGLHACAKCSCPGMGR